MTKSLASRTLSTSIRPTKTSLAKDDMKELTKAFHYLVSTENTKCVDIVREFLEKHKEMVRVFANLTDSKGRKAINIALEDQRKEIHRYLHVCGRYRLDERALVRGWCLSFRHLCLSGVRVFVTGV